mgnify:CR=1 FL=1
MNNFKISKFWNNPGKAYMSMNAQDLNNLYEQGYVSVVKNRCKKAYTLTDFKLAILQANQGAKTDSNIFLVDLMLFALGKIEDYESSILELEATLENFEKEKLEINERK